MKNKILIAAVVIVVVGCSTRFIYFHLDWLIPWYISDYISLDSEQKNMLEKRLLAQLEWHCRTQLPVYAEALRVLGNDVADPANPIDVERLRFHYARFMELWQALLREIASDVTDLLLTASDEQIDELFANLASRNQEFREKYVDLPANELDKNRQAQMLKRVDYWISDPTALQIQAVAEWNATLMPIAEQWLQNRERTQAHARTVLEKRDDSLEFRKEMFDLIVYSERLRPEAYQQKIDFNTDVTLKLMVQLDRLLTDEQRQHFIKRIESLASDLDSISCDPYTIKTENKRIRAR
ncbi:MAG: DUF6279 family lipoprotein [Desulfobacterales bacterium]|nr:DUF6279 family lipoprotein [Desulfobacterales bacterium]